MDIEQLQQVWAAHKDAEDQLSDKLQILTVQAKNSRGLNRWILGQKLQILLGLLFSLAGGSFWFGHSDNWQLVICGVLVHLYGIALIVFGIRLLQLLKKVDLSEPVTTIQQGLLSVEKEPNSTAICDCASPVFLWLPTAVVLFKRLGLEWSAPLTNLWSLSCFLLGIVGMFATIQTYLWAKRQTTSPFAISFLRQVHGDTLTELRLDLAAIKEFSK